MGGHVFYFIAFLHLLSLPCVHASGNHWVVIVAGSKTYDNYRHQANACHAYQLVKKAGVDPSRIILMMYDDAANNHQNPYKGTLINRPNGTDVYHGCKIDYRHWEVTRHNFIKVLKGEKEELQKELGREDAKVLESGPNDHVFITYTDHGAPGLIGFPIFGDLHVSDFQSTIQWMHDNKRYAQMVLYIEACESGSMFEKFPKDINVFAVSSTTKDEMGFACYFDEKRNVFLSDYYSAAWMEDTEVADLNTETFLDQYNVTYNRSTSGKNKAHPQLFGNISLATSVLAKFIAGEKMNHDLSFFSERKQKIHNDVINDAVPIEMVTIETLKRKLRKAEGILEYKDLKHKLDKEYKLFYLSKKFMDRIVELSLRKYSNIQVEEIFKRSDMSPENDFCYKQSIRFAKRFCPSLANDDLFYVYRRYYLLSKLCNRINIRDILDSIVEASEKVCNF